MQTISSARRSTRSGVELNIAPLIDMVFILLIFFLVTTSFVNPTSWFLSPAGPFFGGAKSVYQTISIC